VAERRKRRLSGGGRAGIQHADRHAIAQAGVMRRAFERGLDSPRTPYVAAAISLAIGLFFTFVWAPHPWGWQGIDAYHALARALSQGEPFNTTDVPWGYAYFAAAFYVMFGERVWIPITAQVIANATVPVMLYELVRPYRGRRTAALAALVTGVFSFNTVYASTQASDAVCTVLFIAALLCLSSAYRSQRLGPLVLAGVLLGLAPQFRPNLVLFPGAVVILYLWQRPRSLAKLAHMALFVTVIVLVQAPWIIRNYRLTGLFLPTSTHGGVQLWYGTLQVGPHLESRAHNPRSIFESAAFDYTSITKRPIVITAEHAPCLPRPGETLELVYWTDRQAQRLRTAAARLGDRFTFEIPAQPVPTTLYYYLEASWPPANSEPEARFVTPLDGPANPYVSFVSTDHLGDLDGHDDLLDIFDIVRLLRHLAWDEPLRAAERLDLDHDRDVDEADLVAATAILLPETRGASGAAVERSDRAVTLRLKDRSSLAVPRSSSQWTDLEVHGELAGSLASRWRTFTSIAHPPRNPGSGECLVANRLGINNVFYRGEPHMMQRYFALAMDNIARSPGAFAAASAYRAIRLFIIRGTDDVAITQQYSFGAVAYRAGTLLSAGYFAFFLAGAVIAWRERSPLCWLLVPIAYVPLTICFVLTNMRYSITMQPLMFVFVSIALMKALGLDRPNAGGTDES
jgi:hypothetical protein